MPSEPHEETSPERSIAFRELYDAVSARLAAGSRRDELVVALVRDGYAPAAAVEFVEYVQKATSPRRRGLFRLMRRLFRNIRGAW